jgi:hypothetical protein
MKPFSKTYYVGDLHITIRIKRDELCLMGCRLTIKQKCTYNLYRILYIQFYNDKNLFREYEKGMVECKIPRTTIDDIMKDIKINLMSEKVVTYKPIKNITFPFTRF